MPQTSITRRYHAECAHFLPKVPDGHKCKRVHGHNYEFEISIVGEMKDGWVLDFAELDEIVDPLIKAIDHRLLNDIRGLENPTAEVIAWWLLERIDDALIFRAGQDNRQIRVDAVKVFETKDCWALAVAPFRYVVVQEEETSAEPAMADAS